VLRRSLILTLLGLPGFLAVTVGPERLGHAGSEQHGARPAQPPAGGEERAVDATWSGWRDDAGVPGAKGQGENGRHSGEVKDRLNVLHKYGALAYLLPLLRAGEPSRLESGAREALILLRSDHQLFSSALHNEQAPGSPSLAAVRKSLDFKALDAMSRSGDVEGIGARGQAAGSVHRRPIHPPAPSFAAQQGLLGLPLSGERDYLTVGKIGTGAESILHHGGLFVSAPQGEPIRSVFRGSVIFAEWFKEYGKVMIIDHGEHYCSLIAHADQLLKRVNDTVETGEVIATVGRSGALKVPGLYFEIRHHGSQVDPLQWLKTEKTSKE
jgi:murein DD-endopeptidase MepM/ murein hydrolase activator NlpD